MQKAMTIAYAVGRNLYLNRLFCKCWGSKIHL